MHWLLSSPNTHGGSSPHSRGSRSFAAQFAPSPPPSTTAQLSSHPPTTPMSTSSGTPVRDADLQARIEELERQLGTYEDVPEAQTLANSAAGSRQAATAAAAAAAGDGNGGGVAPEAQRFLGKVDRKKQEKAARKAAAFLEKTELHPSKRHGIVGAADRVVVPSYAINGGADIKWEADPCDIDLKGIINPQEYFNAISELNEACSHARATAIDAALAVSAGFLLLPLIPWAIRHRKHRTKHKKILVEYLRRFNNQYVHRGVRMRWRRKPYSELVIERFPIDGQVMAPAELQAPGALVHARPAEVVNPALRGSSGSVGGGVGGGGGGGGGGGDNSGGVDAGDGDGALVMAVATVVGGGHSSGARAP